MKYILLTLMITLRIPCSAIVLNNCTIQNITIISDAYTPEAYFTYNLSTSSYARITSYNVAGGLDVVLPPTIDAYPTAEIYASGMDALAITTLRIPDNSALRGGGSFTINDSGFKLCTSLTTVTFDCPVKMESYSFGGCSSLTTVNGEIDQTSIYDYTFTNCPIVHFELGAGITYFGGGSWGTHMGLYGADLYTSYIANGAGTYDYSGGVWTKS